MSRSRSPSCSPPVDVDSESDLPPPSPTCPSPPPQPVAEECFRSSNAVFVKRWCRGSNSCSRCDFEFMPLAGSRLACKRAERLAKPSGSSHHSLSSSGAGTGGSSSKHSSGACKAYDEKRCEIKKEEKLSPVLKKRPLPDENTSDAQITSSLMGPAGQNLLGFGGPMMPPFVADNPAWRAYMLMHDPTPALRQLSEYAKPHLSGKQDLLRAPGPQAQGPSGLPPVVDPYGRLPGDSPAIRAQQTRERLEELEKRAHLDSKESLRDDTKPAHDWPTPTSPNPIRPLPPGVAGPLEMQWAELQRLYASSLGPPGSGGPGAVPSLPPGWYPPPNLAAELLQRERLEQLAGSIYPNPADPAALAAVAAAAGRLPGGDRLALPTDPLFRLQMASGLGGPPGSVDPLGIGASTAEMSHTHTHSHTHLHLHQPDPASAAAASMFPPFHPLFASHFLPMSGLGLPGPSSAAALQGLAAPGASSALPGGLPFMPMNPASYNIAAGQQLAAVAAREQELLYRELLSRAPSDPVLAQQLLAQAAAQQEAARRLDHEHGLKMHGGVMPR